MPFHPCRRQAIKSFYPVADDNSLLRLLLDSIAVSVLSLFFLILNQKQIQKTIWWWDELACLYGDGYGDGDGGGDGFGGHVKIFYRV